MKSNLLISIAIALAGFFIGQGIVKFKKLDQAIDVRGLSERMVDSNEASFRLNFIESSNDMLDLNKKTLKAQNAILAFFKSQGFEEIEIEKDAVRITDKLSEGYNSNDSSPRYTSRGAVVVASNKVDAVAKAKMNSDKLLEQGIVITDSYLSYYFTALNEIKPQMLEEATLNAKEAASSFAKTSGVKLGKIKSATQGLFSISSPFEDSYDEKSSRRKKVRVVSQLKFFLDI